MSMRLSCLLSLLALAASLFPNPAGASGLGELAKKERTVKGNLPNEPPKNMQEKDPVRDSLNVETKERSGAMFTIGLLQGGLIMGPESNFQFLGSQFDEKALVVEKLDLGIQWGIFRFYFAPPPKGTPRVLGAAPGEVRIKTPAGLVQLYGTDVYIRVERQGGATTVSVAEVYVKVAGSGREGTVEKGQWLYVPPGKPPGDPEPWPPGPGPGDGDPRPHFPEFWQPPEPPRLLIRLDLPL